MGQPFPSDSHLFPPVRGTARPVRREPFPLTANEALDSGSTTASSELPGELADFLDQASTRCDDLRQARENASDRHLRAMANAEEPYLRRPSAPRDAVALSRVLRDERAILEELVRSNERATTEYLRLTDELDLLDLRLDQGLWRDVDRARGGSEGRSPAFPAPRRMRATELGDFDDLTLSGSRIDPPARRAVREDFDFA